MKFPSHPRLTLIGFAVAGLMFIAPGVEAKVELSGKIEPEFRVFTQDASDTLQSSWDFSVAAEVTFEALWAGGDHNFVVTPFARWDNSDDERTHFDLREARYEGAFDHFEIRIGLDKVFWGVTEVAHVIDIINQTDAIESPDGEEKLGQPMVNVSVPSSWGTFDFFYLPYFRERTFESFEGRPRPDLAVDSSQATYEDGQDEWHPDFAVRWSHYFGDWDIGLSYFDGTGRDPVFSLGLDGMGRFVLVPNYVQIEQASVDVQATIGPWLWKLEGLTREELGTRYAQATGGIEYSFYGVGGSSSDLGIVMEYIWDERGKEAANPLDNEGFLGLRWALNDEASSALLVGGLIDFDHEGWSARAEFERRLGSDYFLTIEAQFMGDMPMPDPLYTLQDDDFLQVRLARYF